LRNIFQKTIIPLLVAVVLPVCSIVAQTNPAPQTLPLTQNFGTSSFTTLPSGFSAWNGINGATIFTQALAEASAPTGNATINSAIIAQTTGGVYGYCALSDAKAYIQTSGNTTNGVNQLALAISTKGLTDIKINYSITMISAQARSIGCILQYRSTSTGPWTSVDSSVYSYTSGTRSVGQEDFYTDLLLAVAAENKDTVQLRWALWRGTEAGNSSGIAIDNISIYSGSSGVIPPTPILSLPGDNATEQPSALTLSWNASTGATSYHLQLSTNSFFSPVSLDSANLAGLSLNVSGLLDNSKYYWRVSASNSTGSSLFSTIRSFSTHWTTIPSVPSLLSPTDNAAGIALTPALSWGPASGAVTYRLQVAVDSLFTTVMQDDTALVVPQKRLSPLTGSMKYWWRVSAKNTIGVSAFSSVRSFTTAAAYKVPQVVLFSGTSGNALLDSIRANFTTPTTLGYNGARDTLYGDIDKVNDSLTCVYSGYTIYMPPSVPPRTAATNGGMNAEHSFPQSFGAASGNPNSDMHHIYAAKGSVNSLRGNLPFGEIPDTSVLTWFRNNESRSTPPLTDLFEYSKVDSFAFEPRKAHKGHVARAIFYFYTIYRTEASAAGGTPFFEGMRETLLRWHATCQIDSSEYARTIKIASHQGGKANPFIIDTTLVRRAYQTTSNVVPLFVNVPQTCSLEQNYPNPFNPKTTISFTITVSGTVTLRIYDLLGREQTTLCDEHLTAGAYAVPFDATKFGSGVYFYRLQIGNTSITRRMILLK
jgi:hypothetical protein